MARVGKNGIIDVTQEFETEEQCLAYLEAMRWPEGVRCVKCDHCKVSKFRSRSTKQADRRLYQCLNPMCKHQFSATARTIFHNTHLPLNRWFLAIALVCNSKNGISAKQMERSLGVSYRTAWYLNHRIRVAMAEG
jgi:hypothetical protein